MRKTLLRLAVLVLMGGTTLSFVSCNKDYEEDLNSLRDDVNEGLKKQSQDLEKAIAESEKAMKEYVDAAAEAAKKYAENVAAAEAAAAKAEAIAEANEFTEKEVEKGVQEAIAAANKYTDQALKEAKEYADNAAAEAAEKAKLELLLAMEEKCNQVLNDAKDYTDQKIKDLKDDLEKVLSGKFEDIENDIDALDTYTRTLKSELDNLKLDYATFKADTEAKINCINDKLANINTRIDGIEDDIDAIQLKLQTLEDTLASEVKRLEDMINTINATLAEHADDIEALQNTVVEIRNEMAEMRTQLEEMINTEVNKLRSDVEELVANTVTELKGIIETAQQNAIDSAKTYTDEQKAILDKAIEDLQNQLDELERVNKEKFEDVYNQLGEAQLHIQTINTILEGYGVRISALEKQMVALENKLVEGLANLEAKLQGNIDALKEEMVNQLKELTTWLENLQISSETNSELIKEMYEMIFELESNHYNDLTDLRKDMNTRFEEVYAHIEDITNALELEMNRIKGALEAQLAEYAQNAQNYTDEQIALIKVITETLQSQLDEVNALLDSLDQYRNESKAKFREISLNILDIEQVLAYVKELAEANQIRIDAIDATLTDLTARIDEIENILDVDMANLKKDMEENMNALLAALEDVQITMGLQLNNEIAAIHELLKTYATTDDVNATVQDLRNDTEVALTDLREFVKEQIKELKNELLGKFQDLGVDLGIAIGEAAKEAEQNAKDYTDAQIADIKDLINALSAVLPQIQDLQDQANQNTTDIDALYTSYSQLAQQMLVIKTIQSTLGDYGIRLKNLEDGLEDITDKVKQFGISIEELTSKVNGLISDMDGVLTSIQGLEARIDALEKAGQSGADLTQVFAALDKVNNILSQRLVSMNFIPEFFDKVTNTPVIPFKSIRYNVITLGFDDEVTVDPEKTVKASGTTTLRFNVAPSNVTKEGIERISFLDNKVTLLAAGDSQKDEFLKATDWKINANQELEVSVERNASKDVATGNQKTTVAMKAFIAKDLLTANEKEAFVVSDYIPVVESNYSVKLAHNPGSYLDYNFRNTLAEVKDSAYEPFQTYVYGSNKFTLSIDAIAAIFTNEAVSSDVNAVTGSQVNNEGFSVQLGICSESISDVNINQIAASGDTTFQIVNDAVYYLYAILVDNANGNIADIKYFAVRK